MQRTRVHHTHTHTQHNTPECARMGATLGAHAAADAAQQGLSPRPSKPFLRALRSSLSTTYSSQAPQAARRHTHVQPVQRIRCAIAGNPSLETAALWHDCPYSHASSVTAHASIDAPLPPSLSQPPAGLGGGDLGWPFNAGPFGSDWSTQGRQSLKCDVYETPVRVCACAWSACAQLGAARAGAGGWAPPVQGC